MNRRNLVLTAGAAVLSGAAGPAAAQGEPTPAAMRLHRNSIVIDGTNAMQMDEERIRLLKAGGVKCAVKAAGDFQGHARMLAFLDAHSKDVAHAKTVRDIRRIAGEGRIGIVFQWQSSEALLNDPGFPTSLRAYRELGLRIVGLVYNRATAFGGGSLDSDVRLTDKGRQLVEAINNNHMVLDVGGHTGEATAFDAIAMTRGVPVVCTHTNVRALNDNPRCMTDKLIETIAGTGGVVGLTAFNDFMARNLANNSQPRTPQVGIDKYLDQFDYMKKLVGVDHIGVGADHVESKGRVNIDPVFAMPPIAYSEQPWFYVKGFESISEYPNVTQGLLGRGWSEADIRKVLGENWLRVYAKVWGA